MEPSGRRPPRGSSSSGNAKKKKRRANGLRKRGRGGRSSSGLSGEEQDSANIIATGSEKSNGQITKSAPAARLRSESVGSTESDSVTGNDLERDEWLAGKKLAKDAARQQRKQDQIDAQRRLRTSDEGKLDVSGPYNVKKEHIMDLNMRWEGDPAQHFDLHEMVGFGAFGKVFRATVRATGAVLAAKIINCGFIDDEALRNLTNEIELLRSCSHETVVSYYGCCSMGRYVWILMDFLPLGDVMTFQERSGKLFKEKHISAILRQTVLGLAYLHAKNVVHRDVKGGNILLTQDGNARLADFGISTQIEAGTDSVVNAGSPFWMAPETLAPLPQGGTQADIWSLGVTAYEVTIQEPPHFALEPADAVQKILAGPPPSLSAPIERKRRKTSRSLCAFVEQCCQYDATMRPCAADLANHRLFAKYSKDLGSSKVFVRMRESFYDYSRLERQRQERANKKRRKRTSADSPEDGPPLDIHTDPNIAAKMMRAMEVDAQRYTTADEAQAVSTAIGGSPSRETASRPDTPLLGGPHYSANSRYSAGGHSVHGGMSNKRSQCCQII